LAPEEFTQLLENRMNTWFSVFDLKKYHQKYQHFLNCLLCG